MTPTRQRVAAEVVELGQTLFDAALDAAQRSPPEADGPFPEQELRQAAEAFFAAVRMLLGLAESPESPPS